MTRILLIRHGETDHNVNGILQGQDDIDLNETGLDQARRLGERLREEDVSAVYASRLTRAQRTAELVAAHHGLSVETLPALKERDYGVFTGEDKQSFQDRLREEGVETGDYRPENGENYEDIAHRGLPRLEQLRERHDGETVAIISHGSINKAMIATVLGGEPGHGHRLSQDNTCINELVYEEHYGWKVHRVNDTSHLD